LVVMSSDLEALAGSLLVGKVCSSNTRTGTYVKGFIISPRY